MSLCMDLQHIHTDLCQLIEGNFLQYKGFFFHHVQFRQPDDIIDHPKKPWRTSMNLGTKSLDFLSRRHMMLNQLRITGYRRQRRLQFVRNIGCKFLPQPDRSHQILMLPADFLNKRKHFLINRKFIPRI